jgi:hypothetical protein
MLLEDLTAKKAAATTAPIRKALSIDTGNSDETTP